MLSIKQTNCPRPIPDSIILASAGRGQDYARQYINLNQLTHTFPVGSFLGPSQNNPLFQVINSLYLPDIPSKVASWLKVLQDCSLKPNLNLQAWKSGLSLAWITLSDKGAAGHREDKSGPLVPEIIGKNLELSLVQGYIIPDNTHDLQDLLVNLALRQEFDLVLTTGGTGVTSRDITPEATLKVLERRLPGFEQVMLQASLKKTPHACISRAVAGTLHRTLIFNLPGSPKAVQENLTPLLPALAHTLDKLHDSEAECAG